MPASIALRAAESAAKPAAYGVLLREPLKPAPPELDQQTVLPCGSVMVTNVLLKLDWIYARPTGTFLRSRRRALAGPRLRSATRSLLRHLEVPSSKLEGIMPLQTSNLELPTRSNYFFAAALRRPATVRRGPFRIRAFVRVRWPWTGRLRRWRMPR